MSSLADRVIVVTGASSGIGRALALELARRRARLVLAARDEGRLAETVDRCHVLNAHAIAVRTDVTSPEDCRRLIEQAVAHHGRLDVLVNNAGQAMWCPFDELADVSILEQLMRVNYLGSVYCTQYALPHLKQSRGLLVAISSLSGLVGAPQLSGYSASKHAVIGFFESLRMELADSGVGVTIVAPDFVQSQILARAVDSHGAQLGYSPLDQDKLLSAERCARQIVRAIERRQRLALTSARSAWARWGQLLAPKLVDRIVSKSVRPAKKSILGQTGKTG